ncbi:hypothetical protein EVAR_52383_1 [Eumeta japonica]|uniref:Uncharacterized protein n=1 Tax=Eumeta variegata TaxID=151549 RepID=A0A4C1YQA0_EUMVA|nr:hypothetical protein EVAR_52383_1 [Eumeta japonica]
MSTKSQSRIEEVAASHIKSTEPRLRTLQSRMVKRPLRSNSDGAQHKSPEWEQTSCPSSPQRNRRRFDSSPPSQPSLKETNELLLKGKEAWRCRQHEARCKSIAAGACNHSEIVLALSDSRSRHKYNLEAERQTRTRTGANRKAHNKDLTNVVKTLTEELSQARRRPKSLDETKSIRDWLGYETEKTRRQTKT